MAWHHEIPSLTCKNLCFNMSEFDERLPWMSGSRHVGMIGSIGAEEETGSAGRRPVLLIARSTRP
jgi:hypothetical protein